MNRYPDDAPAESAETSNPELPYTDPESGFLRNEVSATTHEEIDQAAAEVLPERLKALADDPIPCTGDREQLQATHRLLFDGIFDWAGEFRKTDIDKEGTDFTPAAEVDSAIDELFTELAAEDLLRGLPRPRFVRRLAYYYARLNDIHPFREGNGRTQRLFWAQVALHAGWYVDLEGMDKAENNEASRVASQDGDLEPLAVLLDERTRVTANVEQGEKDLRKTVQRKQRWRSFLNWLRSHANRDRLT